jgi:hypothetical protein
LVLAFGGGAGGAACRAGRARPLPAADELYDLKLGAGAENRFSPEGLLDNATVQFHGDARGVQPQLAQQAKEGLTFRGGVGPAIYYDVDGHVG